MHRHHRLALLVVAAAFTLDAGLGLAYAAVTPGLTALHGLYCALANAVTVGGDVPPSNVAGYAVQAAECLLVVPLFAATLSLFTSGLTGGQVSDAEDRIKKRIEGQREDSA